jgi:putative flippase GtrA
MGEGWRYLLVGAIAWVFDYLLFVVLFPFIGVIAAQTVARISGAVLTFFGHKLFVHRDRRSEGRVVSSQVLAYFLVWMLSYTLSLAGLVLVIDHWDWHPVIAKLLVEAVILGLNFVLIRRIFRQTDSP